MSDQLRMKVGGKVKGEFLGETFEATIQHIAPDRHASILLGWKDGEKRLTLSWGLHSGLAGGHMLEGYQYGYWITPSYLIPVVGGTSASQGMKCARCGEFNSYAVPNQPDSTHKCYTCRQSH